MDYILGQSVPKKRTLVERAAMVRGVPFVNYLDGDLMASRSAFIGDFLCLLAGCNPGGGGVLCLEKGTDCGPTARERWLS